MLNFLDLLCSAGRVRVYVRVRVCRFLNVIKFAYDLISNSPGHSDSKQIHDISNNRLLALESALLSSSNNKGSDKVVRMWVEEWVKLFDTSYHADYIQFGKPITGPLLHRLFRNLLTHCFFKVVTAMNPSSNFQAPFPKDFLSDWYKMLLEVPSVLESRIFWSSTLLFDVNNPIARELCTVLNWTPIAVTLFHNHWSFLIIFIINYSCHCSRACEYCRLHLLYYQLL